jgi:hypothetical protein
VNPLQKSDGGNAPLAANNKTNISGSKTLSLTRPTTFPLLKT